MAPPKPNSLFPRDAIGAGRRASFGAKALGSFVPSLTAKAFSKFGFSASALVTDWPAIVGRELAGLTAPERLTWPRATSDDGDAPGVRSRRSGATLLLRVEGSRALEVQYAARQIIERVNTHFGYAAVAQLRIVQGPCAAATPAPQATAQRKTGLPARDIPGFSDPRLRDALARLAAQVHAGG